MRIEKGMNVFRHVTAWMRASLMVVFLTMASLETIQAQVLDQSVPVVGSQLPDFETEITSGGVEETVSTSTCLGRWLILDFWTLSCKACIDSFVKVQAMRDENPAVRFLMIGNNSSNNRGIESFFHRYSAKYGIKLDVAYDSALFDKWGIGVVPHLLIVDPQGIVRYKTDGRDLTSAKLSQIVEGVPVSLYNPSLANRRTYAANSFSETEILYGSVLSKWNGERQYSGYPFRDYVANASQRKEDWRVAMVPLYALYNYAYLGRWDWSQFDEDFHGKVARTPILQLKDSSQFDFDYKEVVGKGTYNCRIEFPEENLSEEALMNEMRRLLKAVFGYRVRIVSRKGPVWALVSTSRKMTQEVRTSGGATYNSSDENLDISRGFKLQNAPMASIVGLLQSNLNDSRRLPLVNRTGITSNVDIDLIGDLIDLDGINKALSSHGLKIVESVQRMKTLVIFD